MACGAPLTSNHGSPIAPELTQEFNSLLISLNEAKELAKNTITLLKNTQLRKKLRYQANITMEQRFKLHSSLMAYEHILQKITHQNSATTHPD
jgi:glycosyltransferase involved in cell wall biosynthesis